MPSCQAIPEQTTPNRKRPQMMRNRSIWLVSLIGVVSLLCVSLRTEAQSDTVVWSPPRNLSNTLASSGRPAIISDGHGYVHVFWSEEVGGPSIKGKPNALIHTGNTIIHTRWDGVSWTQPTDILFVPGETVADYIAVTVDKNNRLHVVWTGGSDFYYSTALSEEAHSAQAWSAPIRVASDSARSQWESDIVIGADGTIHILYATRGEVPGVYHVRSSDGGVIWSLPVKISLPLNNYESTFSNVRVITDAADHLHVVWQTNEEEGDGQGIYYARSANRRHRLVNANSNGQSRPGQQIQLSFPSIVSVGASELHMSICRWRGIDWTLSSHLDEMAA